MKSLHATSAIILAALSATSEAHMLLNQPMRFPSQDVPDNGPLVTAVQSGANNYPCKLTSASQTYQFDFPRTEMALGSSQKAQFVGQATHGGGSCQFSLTKDLEPDVSSVFKVIHTIQGGCPARNTPGNMGGSATATDPFEYDYTIPSELEPGNYTFAWTWFNKVGNREMYMNCAPVSITPGSGSSKRDTGSDDFFNSLPDMLVGNINLEPIKDNCASPPDGTDLLYPNPGKSVETNSQGSVFTPPIMLNGVNCYAPINIDSAKNAPSGNGTSPSSGTGGGGSGSSPSPSAVSSSISLTLPSPTPTPSSSSGGGYSGGGGSGSGSSAGPSTPSATPVPSSGAGAGASGAQCPSDTVQCSSPGSLVCMSATQFGICNQNNCAVIQPVAAGTQCQGGQITRRGLRLPPRARSRGNWNLGFRFRP